jgi:pimeloyl-ACP methyl ester carboxylesterase
MEGLYRRQLRSGAGLSEDAVDILDHRIVYLKRSPEGGEGAMMMLVHGFGADKDSWAWMAAHIPRRFGLLIPDLPGWGESTQHWLSSYDVAAQATRLAAFLESMGVGRVHLVGSSMGGNIAARLAIERPDLIRTLTLMAPLGVQAPEPSEAERELLGGRNPMIVETTAQFDRMMELIFVQCPAPLRNPIARQYMAGKFREAAPFSRRVFEDLQRAPDWLSPDDLARIAAPSLLLWGDSDRVIPPECGPLWQRHMPHAQLEILPACGHAPMAERPSDTALALLTFLSA